MSEASASTGMAEAVITWLLARLAMPRMARRIYGAVCRELAHMLLDEAARQDAVVAAQTARAASPGAPRDATPRELSLGAVL